MKHLLYLFVYPFLAFIALFIVIAFFLPDYGNILAWMLTAYLVAVLIIVIRWVWKMMLKSLEKYPSVKPPKNKKVLAQKPPAKKQPDYDDDRPTERQVEFIFDLLDERKVPDSWDVNPETKEEASKLIEKLLNRPYKWD